ncbi:MAG TPA: DinB family protein [Steroidobacteraceae bacterium]|nr:DinB family protein [Steroidobacteraceae bacterium]
MADFNPSNEADLLLAANDDVQRALANIAPEGWGHSAPGEWSAAEIVGHMIEMEPYWARVAATVAQRPGSEAGRATDDARRLGGPETGSGLTPQQAADSLTAAGNQAADIVREIPPQDAEKSGRRRDGTPMTVQQIIQQLLVGHAREHTRQLLAALGA